MKVFYSIDQWLESRNALNNESLGFVPTMGALHHGHASLVKKSLEENQKTLVSIFVNPTQFNDKSDLSTYPIKTEEDLELLQALSVDYVLMPEYKELYPDSYRYKISENDLSQKLCGKHRPGHFDGVLTVVMKLLNIAQANRAYFGEKDYQQFLLIRDMVKAFFMKTQIIPCPTVREQDQLAMSSRNLKLSNQQRELAAKFYEILKNSPSEEKALAALKESGFQPDYIEEFENRRLGAAYLGDVRLIDNVEV